MPQELKKTGLPQEGLKLVACVSMLVDHIGAALVPWMPLRLIGRLSFPIFCFLLVEGVFRTRDVKKYLLRLALAAVLSELPFDLLFSGTLDWSNQSVMLTLLLGCLMVAYLPRIPGVMGQTVLISIFVLTSDLLCTDYGGWGIMMIAVFALTRGKPNCVWWQAGALAVIGWMMGAPTAVEMGIPVQAFAALAMIPIGLYSGRKMTVSKAVQWGFYLFYPLHLLALWLIKP